MGAWTTLRGLMGRGTRAVPVTDPLTIDTPPAIGDGDVAVWLTDRAQWVALPTAERRHLLSYGGSFYHHVSTRSSGHWVYDRLSAKSAQGGPHV